MVQLWAQDVIAFESMKGRGSNKNLSADQFQFGATHAPFQPQGQIIQAHI
jgi:hypothetical protein